MTEPQATTERRCPRCGAVLPPEAYYEPLGCATPERERAWRVRHRREDGGRCVAYAGAEIEQEAGAGW